MVRSLLAFTPMTRQARELDAIRTGLLEGMANLFVRMSTREAEAEIANLWFSMVEAKRDLVREYPKLTLVPQIDCLDDIENPLHDDLLLAPYYAKQRGH